MTKNYVMPVYNRTVDIVVTREDGDNLIVFSGINRDEKIATYDLDTKKFEVVSPTLNHFLELEAISDVCKFLTAIL